MPTHDRIENIDLKTYRASIMLYGEPGTGKTWFCGTAPKPHFLCSEEGIVGLRIAGIKGGFTTFKDYNDFLVALGDLENNDVLHKVEPFDTLCLDSLTELSYVIYNEVKRITGQNVLRIQDWGLVTDKTRMCVNQLLGFKRQGKAHVIVTAHEETREDQQTKQRYWGPLMLGKFRNSVAGAFDYFLYSKSEAIYSTEGKRSAKFYVCTVREGMFPAKDRTGTLDMVEPNSFPTVWAKLVSAKRGNLQVEQIK